MYSEIIFYSASFLIILFGFLTIFFKNIFYSLLSAICVFFLIAVLFLLLGSEYNAVIQLAIYGFAIPIILGLGIMFTGKSGHEATSSGSKLKDLLFFFGGLFILAVIYLVLISNTVIPNGFSTNFDYEGINSYDNFRIFTQGIFVKYIYAFEIISVILTITAVGLTMIKKRGNGIK